MPSLILISYEYKRHRPALALGPFVAIPISTVQISKVCGPQPFLKKAFGPLPFGTKSIQMQKILVENLDSLDIQPSFICIQVDVAIHFELKRFWIAGCHQIVYQIPNHFCDRIPRYIGLDRFIQYSHQIGCKLLARICSIWTESVQKSNQIGLQIFTNLVSLPVSNWLLSNTLSNELG